MSETSDLTGPIMELLEKRGILCFRMQSGKIKSRGGGWMKLCRAGTADILAFPRYLCDVAGMGDVGCPRPCWLETKAPNGKTAKEQRGAQEAFRVRVEAEGHRYIVCTSIRDVEAALK